jgi:uncharacterized membrane protein YedE/YeeE
MHDLLPSLMGGALIGLAVAGLLLVNGRIAGVSGILSGAASGRGQGWQWAFLAGLAAAGLAMRLSGAAAPEAFKAQGLGWLAAAGLLVGFGARLGDGCTSGHGVCGLGHLSPRSLMATVTFMAFAAAVVFCVRHVELVQRALVGVGRP